VIRDLNTRFYQFDLNGYSDPFQYAIYQSREGGHYGLACGSNRLAGTAQAFDYAATQ